MSSIDEILRGSAESISGSADFKNKNGNYSEAQTDEVVWTPESGKRIVLIGATISTDTAMNVQIESANVDVIPPLYFGENGGAVTSGGDCPLWIGGADATLTLTSSATGNHSFLLWGYEI